MLLPILVARQNYWMLICLKEYNYFTSCTTLKLIIFSGQTKWRKGRMCAKSLFSYMQSEFKHKQNCSRGNQIALRKYEQSTIPRYLKMPI